jgi:peptide deformylase
MRKLINHKNPILKQLSAEVEKNEDLTELLADLDKMATVFHAYGISAVQLGVLKQVCLFRDDSAKQFKVAINPKILEISETGSLAIEGCLSFPSVSLPIARPFMCKIQFENQQRELVEETYTGLLARVILHEIDHMRGLTIADDLSLLKRTLVNKKISKWQRKIPMANTVYEIL